MSSTRNKRKRAENDATPGTRRRTRDVDEDDVPAPPKNEADGSKPADGTSTANATNDHPSTQKVDAPTASMDEEDEKVEPPVADPEASSTTSQIPSPKTPLHAENAEPSNTSTEDPNPDSRASKIRALITHRTILLSRIRLCRNAAEKRLSVSKTGESDDQEIQAHLHLSKLASQAARKARGDDVPVSEKRTSLALRRGSGVGKRMNAALSSLAPGGGITVGAPPSVPAAFDSSSNLSGGTSFLSKPPPTGALPVTLNPGAAATVPRSSDVVNSTTPSLTTATGPKTTLAQSRQTSVGQIRPSTAKTMKSSTVASSAPGTALPSKDPGRPRIPQSRTIFAEALMLRKKRDMIEGKLRVVLERQKAQQGNIESSFRPKSSGISDPPSRTELPVRRKTHWDRVLQEMNWMATDFIEERKWKAAAGSALSSALKSSDFALGKQAAKLGIPEPRLKVDMIEVKFEDNTKGRTENLISIADEPKYARPSMEELRHAKNVSSVVSTMVRELAIAINEANNAKNSDKSHLAAMDRFKKERARLLDEASTAASEPDNETELQTSAESNPQCGDATAERDGDSGRKVGSKEITFSEINRRLEDLGHDIGKKEEFPRKDLLHATTAKNFSLTEEQFTIVEFVDQLWGSSVGAAVSGMPMSGKTVAACTLLWKHRVYGPQLIVCPPASMLRWKYELCLFNELRVVNFGQTGGIGCSLENPGDVLAVQAGDVVVCAYSSIEKLMALARKRKIKFHTLCVDCRHPAGMFGSLQLQMSAPGKKMEWHGYFELLSTAWWETLVQLEIPRRLTVDYCDPDFRSLERSGLGQRRQLEILSLRSALLLGPENFRPSAYPLQRTIISWARHQGKKAGEDKFKRVRRVLQARLTRFSAPISQSLVASEESWHIRKCEMPVAQRDAYNACCSYVRGALSSPLGDANTQDGLGTTTHSAVAAALLRLRHLCLSACQMPTEAKVGHGALDSGNDCANADLTIVDANSWSMPSDKGSQPNVEVAELLLKSSGKFLELMSVLLHDCGITVECDPSLMHRIPKRKGPAQKSPSKVAILASLPRTQVLLSSLLGAFGVTHKLIRSEGHHNLSNELFPDWEDPSMKHSLYWAETQISLLAFNLEQNLRDTHRLYVCPDIVILSPDTLASWYGGIGIDKADIVISIDEDWSGREIGTMKSALSRWIASRTLRNASTKMIRLISKDTIEEKLYNYSMDGSDHTWPFDPSGGHLLSLEGRLIFPLYKQALCGSESLLQLPGVQLLKMRGELLDAVFVSTTQLAPLFDGSKMCFLPFSDGSSDAELWKGVDLLKSLYHVESGEAPEPESPRTRTSRGWSRILLPLVAVPQTLMSCSDLPFLRARISMARHVVSRNPKSSHTRHRVSLARLSNVGNTSSMLSSDAIGHGESTVPNGNLGSTPNEMANSVLSYMPPFDTVSFNGGVKNKNKDESRSLRVNAYSRVFCASLGNNGLVDGNQGCEPLVFFPPVLPKVQVAPKACVVNPVTNPVRHDMVVSPSKDELVVVGSHATASVTGQKRRDVENQVDTLEQESKRPRVDALSSDETLTPTTKSTDLVTSRVSGSQEEAESTTEKSQTSSSESLEEEDFGLLGRGVLPLPSEAALLLAADSLRMNDGSGDSQFGAAPCDYEEQSAVSIGHGNITLALVALFIKKRRRGLPQRSQGGAPSHLRFDNPAGLTSIRDVHIEDPAKKVKKKSGSQPSTSAFTRIPIVGQNRPGIVPGTLLSNGKDESKHRMLATYVSRQYGTGLSMFESASFRIATIQVQNRVKARVDRANVLLAGEGGSGLPVFALNRPRLSSDVEQGIVHFAPVVHQLQADSNTGDAARTTAAAQLSAFSRSASSPSRVDFGPFESGFLSLTSGMAGLSPTRSRLGVSLPIGVKVANSGQEYQQPSWSGDEDTLLKAAVIRFGMNWIIIARAMSGHQGFLIGRDGADVIRRTTLSSRSSRQCRDRWNSLVRKQPSLANKVRKSETKQWDKDLTAMDTGVENGQVDSVRSSAVPGASDQELLDLLTHSKIFEEDHMMVDAPLPDETNKSSEKSPKKSFAKLKGSILKRKVAPLSFQGIPPGGQPNQPVPSHPSHMQSVQSSVAAQWSNGRTELWPLQILDCADKHRAAISASTERPSEMKPTSSGLDAATSNRSSTGTAVISSHAASSVAPPRPQRPSAVPVPVPGVHGNGNVPPTIRNASNATNSNVER